MDASRSSPPSTARVTRPFIGTHADDAFLRHHFTEAEYDIITRLANSQMVKAWIYFYRFCLKDPLAFALVK